VYENKTFYRVTLNSVAETPERDGFIIKDANTVIKKNWVVFDETATRKPFYYLTPSLRAAGERIPPRVKKVPILETRALSKETWLKVRLPKGEGRDEIKGWLAKDERIIEYSSKGGTLLEYLGILGKIFLLMISMIVVPLIFCSLTVAVGGLGNISQLGRLGGKTFLFFMGTTVCAIIIGLVLANLVKPGTYMSEVDKARLLLEFQSTASQKVVSVQGQEASLLSFLQQFVTQIIPKNPFKAAVEGQILQVLFFAILFGLTIAMLPDDKSKLLINFFDGANEALIMMVTLIMKIAPIGVFGLIAKIVGASGFGILKTLLIYALVVLAGLALHVLLVYSPMVYLFSRINPLNLMKAIRQAQLIAFGTSSSSATYPVTKRCVEENLNISSKISSFVLPLGTTVNMDGTALYQGVATLFVAQVFGMDLSLFQQATIVVTATLASVGAAGVPGVGLITLTMILISVGIPTEGIALILGVDRFLDMFRTMVNVTGDTSCAVVIAASEGEKPKYVPESE
jgi:Na+/H+-dicarboxylate symporter